MTENEETPRTRSLREWLRIADFQVAQSFGAALAAEGVSRREVMLLRALAKGPLTTDRDKKLRSLEDRGWATQRGDGAWELTDDGRAAADRLTAKLDEVNATIRDAVGAEEYETLVSTLEAVARAAGWDENADVPWRGRGWGQGFGPGFGQGFGGGFPPFGAWGPWAAWGARRGYGPGFRPGFPGGWERGGMPGGWAGGMPRGWEHHGHGGWEHHGHGGYGPECHEHHGQYGRGHGHGHSHSAEHGPGGADADAAQAAFERGFAAGFAAREGA